MTAPHRLPCELVQWLSHTSMTRVSGLPPTRSWARHALAAGLVVLRAMLMVMPSRLKAHHAHRCPLRPRNVQPPTHTMPAPRLGTTATGTAVHAAAHSAVVVATAAAATATSAATTTADAAHTAAVTTPAANTHTHHHAHHHHHRDHHCNCCRWHTYYHYWLQ